MKMYNNILTLTTSDIKKSEYFKPLTHLSLSDFNVSFHDIHNSDVAIYIDTVNGSKKILKNRYGPVDEVATESDIEITVSSADGMGKSTVALLLKGYLDSIGIENVLIEDETDKTAFGPTTKSRISMLRDRVKKIKIKTSQKIQPKR